MSSTLASMYSRPDRPASDWIAATPDDDTDLPDHRCMWVAVAGEVHIMNQAGETLPMGDLPAGAILPGHSRRLMAATTATVRLGL